MSRQPFLTTPIKTGRTPPGIPSIGGNEAAERFNFYGMRAALGRLAAISIGCVAVFVFVATACHERGYLQGDQPVPLADAASEV